MRELLSKLDVNFKERDFFKEPFVKKEIQELFSLAPPSELFAWRSPSFKSMSIGRETLNQEDLIGMIEKEPRLLRRPIVRIGEQLVVGSSLGNVESAIGESGYNQQ